MAGSLPLRGFISVCLSGTRGEWELGPGVSRLAASVSRAVCSFGRDDVASQVCPSLEIRKYDFMVSLAYDTYANLIENGDENGLQELLATKTLGIDERSECDRDVAWKRGVFS
ncbi:unnamed protein product [Notodromas monacha]|uniref:Uncharacterized protein n=1 Tax=Notodromas monacha TaxID=399045 RepID=A0A7R9BWF6_9CRUS|nr:unnamed protein product [Notodromas monacha]CAG0922994.1 unnamed protein product [Notodromas monacha]